MITDTFREFFDTPVETAQDVHKQLKRLRRVIAWTGERETPLTIYSWVAAATRYQLLKRGVISNTKINATEEILQGEPEVKVESAERHHAMVNFWRTTLSCILGTLFWLWTGWTSGSGAMVMIAVVERHWQCVCRIHAWWRSTLSTGTLAALPLGLLYFLVIIPNTQQSMLLLCISLAVLGFFLGIKNCRNGDWARWGHWPAR
ncbi:FUSC family protein [Escherichia coli]